MFKSLFNSVTSQCIENLWPVIILNVLLIIVAANFTIKNIKINTNTEDMLSEELTWRKYHSKYKSAFPNTTDNLILIVESSKSNNVSLVTRKLIRKLQESDKFDSVTAIQEIEFLKNKATLP